MNTLDPRQDLESRPHPFQIQELVEQCIGFLRDSPSDLKACALVARPWTSAAQGHIFREVVISAISSVDVWPRLQQILHSSPHLIHHIRRLQLDTEDLSSAALLAICKWPFSNLRYLSIYHLPGLAIHQLLSLPSLTRVKLVSYFSTPSTFLQTWEGLSPKIRHLDLLCDRHPSSPRAGRPIPARRSPPVRLESLKLGSVDYLSHWLTHDFCPLDVSGLKLLSIPSPHGPLLQSEKFVAALQTLKVLDLSLWQSDGILNLSTLPNLRLLRLCTPLRGSVQRALDTLSTITTTSCIRQIILWRSSLDRGACDQLDSKLVSLPVQSLPVLELEMNSIVRGPTIDNLDQFFPRMASTNLLRHKEFQDDNSWFENIVGL
ncbi:hypothetical protein FB451DRAFT_1242208 [Mycena latifolia]|nr:hypothetical protein FB451DRAFT_1242208 [Mycena latifolia]